MTIDVDYPALLNNFREYLAPKRSESASFLIWYLEQYYRLDGVEAVDAVCDQSGDKGVDGIFINNNNQTITVFQSKISQKSSSTIGDAQLRTFLGTLQQFKSKPAAVNLIDSAGNAQVAQLIKYSNLVEKLDSYELRGEFLTNINIDQNGIDFLKIHANEITFVGKKELLSNFISDERDLPKQKTAVFDILGITCAEHVVDGGIKAVIAPIRAKEIVNLDGIEDQSLFTYNVRGPLGRTSVNKDLVRSIRDQSTHKNFPLFHNGITVITKILRVTSDKIEIEGYYVVNGCQSVSSLYGNKSVLTDDLKLLTKFIQMDPTSSEAKQITEYSNNQNGVRARDFKSNDAIQIRLRTEFEKEYKGRYCYEIKRGETSSSGEAISNEEAGLYMMAFDLREPWGTFRKYEVFEDKHNALFGKPYVTADRIVMLRSIYNEIVAQLSNINEKLLAQYMLTRYMLMYIIRETLSGDKVFEDIIQKPETYMRDLTLEKRFCDSIRIFISDIIIDINEESKDFDPEFDYRRNVKSAEWVRDLTKIIRKGFQKNVNRGHQKSFEVEWAKHA